MITYNKQSGAVLIVSLVLLTVLTLIGVSSMQNSSMEMRVASNSQQFNIAFQAAQSRLDFASSNDTANPIDFKIAIPDPADPLTWPVQNCNAIDGCLDEAGGEWLATAQARFGGCGKVDGTSLESGKGFSVRFFDISATGRTSTNTAFSTQAQGLRVPVAGCEDDA